MILAAHQAHYLPWAPYFHKMCAADRFVFADDVQYKTNNFINRTRIKNASGSQWLTVPVETKGRHGQLIREVRIAPGSQWRRKHRKSLWVNYRQAPFFQEYGEAILKLYDRNWRFLIDLNMALMRVLMSILNLPQAIVMSSELSLPRDGTERLIAMAERFGCSVYLSGPGGNKYMDLKRFEMSGIALRFSTYPFPEYDQRFGGFVPGMSIVDMVFNLGLGARNLVENPSLDSARA